MTSFERLFKFQKAALQFSNRSFACTLGGKLGAALLNQTPQFIGREATCLNALESNALFTASFGNDLTTARLFGSLSI